MPKTTMEEGDDLHSLLCRVLKQQLQSGEASGSVLKEAREFLKDNHISGPLSGAKPEVAELAETLPFAMNDE